MLCYHSLTPNSARQKNRELGIQFHKQRNYTEARKYFSRAADVSPFMAHRIIQVLIFPDLFVCI